MLSRALLSIFVLSIALLSSWRSCNALEVVSATYQTKNVTFLGVPVKMREFQVQFDEEVYHLQADFPCPNLQCASVPTGPKAEEPWYRCDPTQEGWCGGMDLGCAPYRELLCKGQQPLYRVIEFGETTYESLAAGTEKYYVYRPVDPCHYITFRADPLWGDPNLFIYHLSDFKGYLDGVFENQRPIREGGFFGPDRFSICPGQTDYPFRMGTHVIVAYPFDSLITATGPAGTNFTLQVLSKPLPPPSPSSSSCSIPSEASNWREPDGSPIPIDKWQCLNDGVASNFTSASGIQTRYFVYTVPAGSVCQHLYWYHWTYGIYIGYAFGNDVQVPYEIAGFKATDRNLVSFSGNPKGDFLVACPSATQAYHLIIKVQPNPTNYFRTLETDFNMVYIDSSSAYRWLEKISDKNPYVATWDLQMSSQLHCKRPNGQLTKRQCNFRLDIGDDAAECSRFWHYYPSDIPIPIFPLNTWLFGDTRFVNFYPKMSSPKGDDRSYFAAALIDYQLDLTEAPISAHENSESLLDTCEIMFMGSIVDFNGVPLPPRRYPLTKRVPSCKYEAYRDVVVPKMMELARETREAKGALDVRDFRVAMDILAYSPYYYDCILFANDLVDTSDVTRTISSTVCNPEQVNYSDPCCNPTLTFNGDGCKARVLSYSVQKFDALTSSASERCKVAGESQCSSLFAADYVVASENARSSLEGCGVNTPNIDTYTGENMRSFRKLSDQWFGKDPGIGHRCSSDEDCSLFSDNSRCDLLRGSCRYSIDRLVHGFLRDWVPTLPYLLKNLTSSAISETMKVPSFDVDNIDAWFSALTSSSDCTGQFAWGWGYRQSYGRAYTLDLNQAVCNLGEYTNGENYCPFRYCFSSACTVDFACQTTLGANLACWSTFAPLRIPLDCVNSQDQDLICNWTPNWNRPSITSAGTPVANPNCFAPGNQLCALCELGSEQPCLSFGNLTLPSVCESKFACFLHDGSIVTTSSEAECTSMMRCNATCYEPSTRALRPCTQFECESGNVGMCDSHVWSYRPNGTYRPACVTPPAPLWGEKSDCPSLPGIKPDEFGRSTPYGCIYYQNATSQPNCMAYGTSASPWYTATDRATCIAPKGCWQIWDDTNFRNDHTFTFKTEEACKEINGEMRSFNQWLPATWRGGIARPLQWIGTSSNTIPFPYQPTINLIALTSSFKRAIDSSYSILQRTETFCRYNPIVRSMTPILCSCADDGLKSPECFPPPESSANSKDTASASFTICQGTGTTEQRASPVTITFDRKTIQGGCHPASVNIFPASTFAQPSTEALSTFLLDFSISKPYQFTNENGALAAQIISDGVILTSDMNMTSVRMCINPRLDIVVNNSLYSVFDFASVDYKKSNPKPTIMFVEGAVKDFAVDSVCADFPSLNTERAYFAIARSADALTRKKSKFPTGETVFYALMCLVYAAASCLAAFRFIAAILAGQLVPRNTQVWIFLTISVMMFLRWLYLILILSGTAVGNSHSAIDYFLVELPSFLYLTVMTFFIIIWATLIKANRTLTKQQNNANFWIIFGVLNGVIYLIFLILIIIYEAVRPKQNFRCGGRLADLDQKVRQRTAIAYRAILATFALVISLAFFVTGISIYRSLKSTTNQRAIRKRKIFWLTSVCSVGLTALSTLLIILASTGAKNNFVALGLLVLFEAVPCIVIIVALWKVESKDTMVGNKRLGAGNSEAMQPLRSYGKAESASRAAPWAKR